MSTRCRLPAALAFAALLMLPACQGEISGGEELPHGPDTQLEHPAPNPGQKPAGESYEEKPGNPGT